MIWRLSLVFAFCAGLFALSQGGSSLITEGHAQMTLTGAGCATAHCGGGCSQATTAIAALDGSQNSTALTTFICGLVSDGNWSGFDAFYVLALGSRANALVNLVNPGTFNWTQTGTNTQCAFSGTQGITSDGANCFGNTGLSPSTATQFAVNNASLLACFLSAPASTTNGTSIGQTNGSDYAEIGGNSPTVFYALNDTLFSNSVTYAAGTWMASRTSSTLITLYENGSSVGTETGTASTLSGTPNFFLFAQNNNGPASSFIAGQFAAFGIGKGFNSTAAGQIRTRLNTYMTTVNGSGC